MIAPIRELTRGIQRAILLRIEPEVRLALLPKGIPLSCGTTLPEDIRIAQPTQQQTAGIRGDQFVEELGIQQPALQVGHRFVHQGGQCPS